MVPSTCPAKQISGGQQEEGHGVVRHVQGEQFQTYLLHHYQMEVPASSVEKFRAGCTYQLYVSHVDKDTVNQSHTKPLVYL